MTNAANKWIKKRRKRLIEEWGGECLFSGSNDNLEFAHLSKTSLSSKGGGRGRKERIYDVINNSDCYVLLCHECHKELDKGKLTIELLS